MKNSMTKADAQAFKARWELVRKAELEELQATTAEQKLQQINSLMISAEQLGWTEELAAGETAVRLRWIKLRNIYDA